jgi:uroporphyrinogen decarboxylase
MYGTINMNHRENLLAALRRENPEYVPFDLQFTPPMQSYFKDITGADDPAEYWDYDFRTVYFEQLPTKVDYSRYLPDDLPENTWVDDWGIANVPGSMHHFTKMIHPLESAVSIETIMDYPLPDYRQKECWQSIKPAVAAFHKREYAVIAGLEVTLFEISWYLRSMEGLMTDLLLQPEMAEALLDRITDLRIFQAQIFARASVDIVALGDDIAMQTGMLLSPKMWRKWFKPRLAAVIEAARSIKPDILVQYHTDGDCRAVIPDLIEIGVDILNPVQPECMDPITIKQDFGDRLSFSGTIGTQTTMPFGTPDNVDSAVKTMIESVGKGGGFLIAPSHVLEPDVPWANVLAFIDAVHKYGPY